MIKVADPYVEFYTGNCLDILPTLEADSVQCVVTSPPYWGLRKYDGEQVVKEWDCAYGLEPTVDMYVEHSIEILCSIKRVLKPDGIVWWNIGDSYAGSNNGSNDYRETDGLGNNPSVRYKGQKPGIGLKPKDLCLIPFRVALAAQADGWYVRSAVIWNKPNPMPESVKDRPTESHEYILMLTKSPRYYFDMEAVREPAQDWGNTRDRSNYRGGTDDPLLKHHGLDKMDFAESGRNIRSVWDITTQPFKDAHFATFPEELPKRCILASTSEKGNCAKCGKPWVRVVQENTINRTRQTGIGQDNLVGTKGRAGEIETITLGWQPSCKCNAGIAKPVVLDPFGGSGTTAKASKELGRKSIYIDTSEKYLEMARKRIMLVTLPMEIV